MSKLHATSVMQRRPVGGNGERDHDASAGKLHADRLARGHAGGSPLLGRCPSVERPAQPNHRHLPPPGSPDRARCRHTAARSGSLSRRLRRPPWPLKSLHSADALIRLRSTPGRRDVRASSLRFAPSVDHQQAKIAAAQQPADPEQRVVAVTATTQRVALHTPADLVKRAEAEPHHVEGIQYPRVAVGKCAWRSRS
jgi:hypothetical protein